MKKNINRIISMLMVFLILFSNGNIFAAGTEELAKTPEIIPLNAYDAPKRTYDGMTFLGEVEGNDLITYDKLISDLGITEGSKPSLPEPTDEVDEYKDIRAKNKEEEDKGGIWFKFIDHKYTRDEKPRIFYVMKKPARKGVSWNTLFTAGAIYGWDVINPTTGKPKANPEFYKNTIYNGKIYTLTKDYKTTIIEIEGKKYIVRLLQGKTNYGGDVTNTKYWETHSENANSE